MDIKGMQHYHCGYVNYNNNGLNNGMNCANGFCVYCHMNTHTHTGTNPEKQDHRISLHYNHILDQI